MKTRLLAGVLFVLAALGARAQDVPNFYLTTPLNIGAGNDYGIPVGHQRVDATGVLLQLPTLTFLKPSPRGDFSLSYMPEFDFYNAATYLNEWNHFGGLRWAHAFTPRWSVDFDDNVVSTKDDSRRFNSALMLPRGRYTENTLYATLGYALGPRTKVKLLYNNSYVNFDSQFLAKPITFSLITNSLGFSVEHHLNDKDKWLLTYARVKSISLDRYDLLGNLTGPSVPAHMVALTWTHKFSPTFLVEGTGGLVHSDLNSYVFGAVIEKTIRKVTIGGGFSRYLTALGTPTATPLRPIALRYDQLGVPASTSFGDTVSVSVRGYVTKRFGIQVEGLATRTTGIPGMNLRSALAAVRLDYRITEHLVAFSNLQLFGQNATEVIPIAINRRRVFGGLEYTFSPTPEEIAHRLDALHSGDTPTLSADAPTAHRTLTTVDMPGAQDTPTNPDDTSGNDASSTPEDK